MKTGYLRKDTFTVIGKEGSTRDGSDFIQNLWAEANAHFGEVQHLAKRDPDGNLVGIWGAMSDFSRSFQPWEDFRSGLYLAGVECVDDALPPEGWVKWVVPGYAYMYADQEDGMTFSQMLTELERQGLSLAGAAQDFTCPQTGKNYVFFPIQKQ